MALTFAGVSTTPVIASVGLAQNLAALRALASEGITQGHNKIIKENKNK